MTCDGSPTLPPQLAQGAMPQRGKRAGGTTIGPHQTKNNKPIGPLILGGLNLIEEKRIIQQGPGYYILYIIDIKFFI